MSKAKKKVVFSLRWRLHAGHTFGSLWLLRHDGQGVTAGLLWGELIPTAAEELIDALGLPVERQEGSILPPPHTPPGCLPVAEQGSLFKEGL